VGCAFVSHTLASIVWQQSVSAHHPSGVVASLHCGHPDAVSDTAVTAAVQFTCVLMLAVLTLRCGSVVVDLCEMIGQIIVNALVFAGGQSSSSSSS